MGNTLDKNTHKELVSLDSEELEKVSGGISNVCSADGGEHDWVTISKDGRTARCSKCRILCTR